MKTTLIEAAQKLITCMKLDRIEAGDWPDDSREAYLGLKQAIAQERTNPCDTCKHRSDGYDDVCANCCNFYANHWEPKPDGYEDTLNALKDERFSI